MLYRKDVVFSVCLIILGELQVAAESNHTRPPKTMFLERLLTEWMNASSLPNEELIIKREHGVAMHEALTGIVEQVTDEKSPWYLLKHFKDMFFKVLNEEDEVVQLDVLNQVLANQDDVMQIAQVIMEQEYNQTFDGDEDAEQSDGEEDAEQYDGDEPEADTELLETGVEEASTALPEPAKEADKKDDGSMGNVFLDL
mmetsp:Transcript_99676/g.197616  ORF Transcript_99676/g.197616 Transcript_99676/m.197616 type:complete len:198 (-) Transcript_99676:70-663(-)|eukprot:CAMPEP_0172814566 /NCGR_PEP_ID=MMETSP1075-20121228/11302_1 /TAXON_ID=2916 /ORGANISM="Ceratium fusus, Strain PA161109" /LENGTH=197 /DNA_ID=CAMNT_0013654367 /DNA_START=29 /DNA_END=622 /DNA_ORIENTATION=+